MILGDHVLERISPVVLIESAQDLNPLHDYFNSLEKIKNYSIKLGLPGHGNTMAGLGNRLEEIKAGHQHRIGSNFIVYTRRGKNSMANMPRSLS